MRILKTIRKYISLLKRVDNLEKAVYELKRPFKYEVGDKVILRERTEDGDLVVKEQSGVIIGRGLVPIDYDDYPDLFDGMEFWRYYLIYFGPDNERRYGEHSIIRKCAESQEQRT